MAVMVKKVKIMKFLLDSMLGRLAKWLRIMGHDTHYQKSYKMSQLYGLIKEERVFITRDSKRANIIGGILLKSDKIEDQVLELKSKIDLRSDPNEWFSRCIICNTKLKKADPQYAKDEVPEYVFIQNREKIKFCPCCNRFYWPGTHREKMIAQLKKWGFYNYLAIIALIISEAFSA